MSPPTLNQSSCRRVSQTIAFKVRQMFRVAAWWLNLYTTKPKTDFFFFSINFLNNCRISIHALNSPVIELSSSSRRERRCCISTPPCLFKDTCWAAWLISSSFSRLSGLRGADYQEELIPVAQLISLIRAPGRWLEGSCVSCMFRHSNLYRRGGCFMLKKTEL